MNWTDIWTLYRRELRSALRERAIVVNSIIIPIVLYPLLIWIGYTGLTYISGQNAEMKSRIMLRGLPAAHDRLKETLKATPEIVLEESAKPEDDVRAGTLDALVEFLPPESQSLTGNFNARVVYDGSRDAGSAARNRVATALDKYRQQYLQQEAARLGISPQEFQGFRVGEKNVSSNTEMGRFLLGLLLPMILVIMLAVGAFYPAVDTTAGERENGTWETLMTLATPRRNILVAKYLYVATMSFVAGGLNVIAMMFSLRAVLGAVVPSGGAPVSVQVPIQSIPVLIAGAALLALFIAAGMMILAAFARTFKEGQSMVSPFYIALILPVTFLQGPSLQFTTRLALIPVVNVAMMFREAISGIYHWRLIAVTAGVEAVCIAAALKVASIILVHEDFVMGSYSGTFGKFLKERILKRS